MKLNFRYWS